MSVLVDPSREDGGCSSDGEAEFERHCRALADVKADGLKRARSGNKLLGVRWRSDLPVPEDIVHRIVQPWFKPSPGMSLGLFDARQLTECLPAELWNGASFKRDRDAAWGDPDWDECVLAMVVEVADRKALGRVMEYLWSQVGGDLVVETEWLDMAGLTNGKWLRLLIVVARPDNLSPRTLLYPDTA